MKNHDTFLQDLRLETLTGNFSEMTEISMDNFSFSFMQPLTKEQQIAVTDFMGLSDHFNALTPVDFCNFFDQKGILFRLSWIPCQEVPENKAVKNAIIIQKINQIREENGL